MKVSDAVYFNMRGDVPAKLRLRYDDLKHLNRKIVCCSLSAFGMTGDLRAEPGYDYILQAMAGWMSLTGEPEAPPAKSGPFGGRLRCRAGRRVQPAGGAAVRVPDGGGHGLRREPLRCRDLVPDLPGDVASDGGSRTAAMSRSAHPSLVPFQAFLAADGWVVIGCAKEKFFARMCTGLGCPEIADNPRYANFELRDAYRDEVIAELDAVIGKLEVDDVVNRMRAEGVPCGPVLSVADALAHPVVAQRGLVIETEHPVFGTVRLPGSPIRVGEPRTEHGRAPRRNEDHRLVLGEILGYDEQRIAEVTAGGAVGPVA